MKMAGDDRSTLLRPQARDPSKAPLENDLEVLEVAVLGKVRFQSLAFALNAHGSLSRHSRTDKNK